MMQAQNKFDLSKNSFYKNIEKFVLVIVISVLFMPVEIRVGLLGKKIGLINYIAIISIVSLAILNKKYVSKKYLIYIYILIMYYLFTLMFQQEEIFTILKVIGVYIIPLAIIGIIIEPNLFVYILRKVILLFNFTVIIITILGILELVLGINISEILSNYMTPRTKELIQIQSQRDVFRLYSFMGHPLFNTQLYLMFFVLNNIYMKYFDTVLNQVTLITISIVGISMTASKTGLILILISVILVTYNKSKITKVVLLALIFMLVASTGIFDNTLTRFSEGSLTSGRDESWKIITESGLFPIKILSGYGHEFTFQLNNYFSWASAAFEYPFRMFSLEFGRVMAILIYIPITLIPMHTLLRRKHIYLFISYMIIFIDINTYNGLAIAGDHMLLLSIFIFIILNISKVLISKENMNYGEKNER